ncbi:helix-turn-helix domain-containing protein [Streptococcus entericus]|uniref:helix-turn-helix domain-containing protein n=1 Tax=Streptococcus entericus TaxID=155680 RepID=UPI0003686259|nr:helix-turn-helix transcriptional regulator [Streptococcus entericus]
MDNFLQHHISKRIRFLRKQKGLTQEKLSELSDLGMNYISTIENKPANIKIESLEKIMAALEISPAQFFNFTIESSNPILNDIIEDIHELPTAKQEKLLSALKLLLSTME